MHLDPVKLSRVSKYDNVIIRAVVVLGRGRVRESTGDAVSQVDEEDGVDHLDFKASLNLPLFDGEILLGSLVVTLK